MALSPYAQEYLDRVKDSVANTSVIGRLSYWMEKHTRLAGKTFSFKDHEFQRAIVDSTHPHQEVIKPSQMGVSEIESRLALGFLAVSPDVVGIYSMPTLGEALRFSKSRVDPVIKASPYLKEKVVAGSDSSSFKQIGTSQLFMMGTYGKALISVPADLFIQDEKDFSNQEVLATAESRMSHSRFEFPEHDIRGFRKAFSTPTVPGYGVSEGFEKSNKLRRLVRCKYCGHHFWPNFLQHCVVSGYDNSFEELTYQEVDDLELRGLLNTAKLLCESCHNPLKPTDLGPDYREWVAEKPSVTAIEGWAITPFDLPKYHTATSLLKKLSKFKGNVGHFRNFTLGLPYADASNGIMPNAVRDNTTLRPVFPGSGPIYGCVAGLDVGLTSWLTIGYPLYDRLEIIWAEQIKVDRTKPDHLYTTVVERVQQYGVTKLVCDNQPFTDTILRIQAFFLKGVVLPCSYSLPDKSLPMYTVQDNNHTVSANRTKTLDYLVKRVNNGQVKFANFPELNTLITHMQGMKRVDRLLDDGEVESNWVKCGSGDHYFHSLNYLNMAADTVTPMTGLIWVPPVGIHTAVPGRKFTPDPEDQKLLIR